MLKLQKYQILALFQGILFAGISSLDSLFPQVTSASQPLGILVAQQHHPLTQATTETRAEQAYWKAVELRNQGTADSLPQAIAQLTEAISLYREAGNRAQEAEVLGFLAFIVSSDLKQYQEALNYYFQALGIWRELGNREKQSNSLFALGQVYSDLGDYPNALQYFQQTLDLQRSLSDELGQALTLVVLGDLYWDLGQGQEALVRYLESIPLSWASQDAAWEAVALDKIAMIYTTQGEAQQALESYLRSLTLWRKTENQAKEASTLYQMAALEQGMGNLEAARRWIAEALQVLQGFCGNADDPQEYPCDAATRQEFEQLHQSLFRQSN